MRWVKPNDESTPGRARLVVEVPVEQEGAIRAALGAVTEAGGGAMVQRVLLEALLTAASRVGIDRIYRMNRILIASNFVSPVNRVQCSAHGRMGVPACWLIC